MKKTPLVALILLAGFLFVMSSCQKELSIETNLPSAAQGSLQDSLGNCLEDSVVGTYYGGITPGRDTAYVEVKVNVTTAGSYAIMSNTQNGIYFSDSGYFSTTGINTIKLKPVGTPIIPGGPYDFNISFDSTTCYFTLNVQDSTGTGLGGGGTIPNGTWEFSTDSSGYFHGTQATATLKPDSVYWGTILDTSFKGGTVLQIVGNTAVGDTALVLYVLFPGNDIIPGTYYTQIVGTDTYAKGLFGFAIKNAPSSIYDAVQDSQSLSKVGITVTYDATTKIVSGTFSGVATNEYYNDTHGTDNVYIGILNGKYSATVQ